MEKLQSTGFRTTQDTLGLTNTNKPDTLDPAFYTTTFPHIKTPSFKKNITVQEPIIQNANSM